jgi:hypothetical protein
MAKLASFPDAGIAELENQPFREDCSKTRRGHVIPTIGVWQPTEHCLQIQRCRVTKTPAEKYQAWSNTL